MNTLICTIARLARSAFEVGTGGQNRILILVEEHSGLWFASVSRETNQNNAQPTGHVKELYFSSKGSTPETALQELEKSLRVVVERKAAEAEEKMRAARAALDGES